MHAEPTTAQPLASGAPDQCGLAPNSLAPLGPTACSPVRRGRVVRIRAGLVRQGRVMRHLASDVGQGTVEYVGILLLMATLLAGVVGAADKLGGKDKIGQKVVDQLGNSIEKVSK